MNTDLVGKQKRKRCAEWEARASLNHVLFAARSVFVMYAFEVTEHEGTSRFARSLEPVPVMVYTFRSSSGLYHPFYGLYHSFYGSYYSLSVSSSQNTLWITLSKHSLDHPLSRLGAAFMLAFTLSATGVTPIIRAGKTWFSRSLGSPFAQAHSRTDSFLFIFAFFFILGLFIFGF